MLIDKLANATSCTCADPPRPDDSIDWHEEKCERWKAHKRATEAAERAAGWHRLKRKDNSGGYRDQLDGQPVHCGAGLELQAVEYVVDKVTGNETRRAAGKTIPVRYEIADRLDGQGKWTRVAKLHADVGGHEFSADAEGLLLRWPVRK